MSSQSETARLLLRPWRQSDVAQWIAISAVSRLMEFFPYVRSRAEAEAEAERLRGRLERDGYGWWALEVKNGPSFAGCIASPDVPFEAPFRPAYQVGSRLCADAWGNGYRPKAPVRRCAAHSTCSNAPEPSRLPRRSTSARGA